MTATVTVPRRHLPAPVLARLRGRLVDELRALARQAAAHDATARQLSGQTDPDSTIERELAVACAARAREGIDEVEEALERVDRGAYGSCQACGRPIPVERLDVIPHARLCVQCPGDFKVPSRRALTLARR